MIIPSDKSPSAPSLSTNIESQNTTTTQPRNVTPVTPSKRPRSQITDTSSITSSTTTSRSPRTEIHITPRSQPSPTTTLLVHISNPESVERYVDYKQPTAIKTVRQLSSLQLPSEKSKNSSKIYPTLKPLRKLSTSL